MTVALFVAALVLLGGAGIAIARSGARHHPESLNTHPDDDRAPVRDRPVGPGAEAMAWIGRASPASRATPTHGAARSDVEGCR